MRKNYKKPIMIDTCVASYILDIHGENDKKIEDLINEKPLKHYLKHHGCWISVFTLFEILRRIKKPNEDFINKLKEYKVEIYTQYNEEDDVFTEKIFDELLDDVKVNKFLKVINKKIINFACEYLSTVLTYPLVLSVYLVYDYNKEKNLITKDLVKDFIISCNKKISGILMNFFEQVSIYKKDPINKIIRKIYKWVGYIGVEWINNEIKDFVNGEISLEAILVSLLNKIDKVNWNNEIKRADGSLYVDGDFNMMYQLFKTLKLNHKMIDDSVFIDNIVNFRGKYYISLSPVEDAYFCKSIYDTYLFNIRDKKNNPAPNMRLDEAFDPNDIIDLMSYNFAYENNIKFISTDGNLNQIIKYIEKDVFFQKVFIRNI